MSFNAYFIHVCERRMFIVLFSCDIYLTSFYFFFIAKGTLSEDTIASFLRQIGKIVIPDIK